jgi:hypothetical protein
MKELYERLLFLALAQKDPAYQEYNKCVDLWKEYSDAGFMFWVLKETIEKMQDKYPAPDFTNLNDLMPYILAESTSRISMLTLLATWTHFSMQEEDTELHVELLKHTISLAEESINDKVFNA